MAHAEQLGRDRAAAEQHRAQAPGPVQPRVAQAAAAGWPRARPASRPSSASMRPPGRSGRGAPRSCAARALRTRIASPAMWNSGSTHSQRSSGSVPIPAADAAAAASWLPTVSSTGLGSPVVPDVNSTVCTAAGSSSVRSSVSASKPSSGASTTVSAPASVGLAALLGAGQAGVERHQRGAEARDRVQQHGEVESRRKGRGHAVALPDAERGEPASRGVGLGVELRVGERPRRGLDRRLLGPGLRCRA